MHTVSPSSWVCSVYFIK